MNRFRIVLSSVATVALLSPLGLVVAGPAAAAPVPVRPAFGPIIDDYADYEREDVCDPTAKPGPLALEDVLVDTYGPATFYIERSCSSGNSGHYAGRAIDWMHDVSDPQEYDEVETFLDWLFAPDQYGNPDAMMRRMGLMYVIWNRQIYESYDPGWEPYTEPNPHTDHVHFSFSWDGAYTRTTYWNPQNSFPATPSCPTPPRQALPAPVDYGAGLGYVPVAPVRLLDTRVAGSGVVSRCQLAAHGRLDLAVLGRGSVPATGVGAVVLNITGVIPDIGTNITAYPAGALVPGTSSVNIAPAEISGALVVVPVGTSGMVSLLNGSGRVDAVVDLVGYHPMSGGARFNLQAPTRALDTRVSGTPFGARETRTVRLAGVPARASAVVLNVSSVSPATGGYLTVNAGGSGGGGTSSLNMIAGRVVTNRVYVGVDDARAVDIFASAAGDLIVDVVGWFAPGGRRYIPVTPVRAFDTRIGLGAPDPLVAGRAEQLSLQAARLPSAAVAAVMTVTATDVEQATHVTVWSHGQPRPGTSDLNTYPGHNTANLVISGLSAGAVDAQVGYGQTDLVGDVLGYFR